MKPFFLLFLFTCLSGQADTLKLNVLGSVKNMQDKTPVTNCPVILKGSDGTLVQTKTDPAGNYALKLKPETTYDIYTQTDKTTTTPTARLGFLASDDHGDFTTIDLQESQNFQKDFELTPVIECLRLPYILFKKNSAVPDTIWQHLAWDTDSSDVFPGNAVASLANLIKRNPTIIIELSAHCSSEETKNAAAADLLSHKRAEMVKAEIVKRGVDPIRIVAKGWGQRKLKVQDAQIAKEKTKEGKEALHAINRRCVFKILSWDYVDPNTSKAEVPKYHHPVKGGEDKEQLPAVEELPGKRMKENKLETPQKN